MPRLTETTLVDIWPGDISAGLQYFIGSHPHASEEDALLFGDERKTSDKRWYVGLGEISVEDFSNYKEPNGQFEKTIEFRCIEKKNPSNLYVQGAMARLLKEYIQKRRYYHYVLILCNFFDKERIGLEITETHPSTLRYVGGIINVTPMNNPETKRRLPFERQRRDWKYKQHIGEVKIRN